MKRGEKRREEKKREGRDSAEKFRLHNPPPQKGIFFAHEKRISTRNNKEKRNARKKEQQR